MVNVKKHNRGEKAAHDGVVHIKPSSQRYPVSLFSFRTNELLL